MVDRLVPDDPRKVGPYPLEGRLGEGGMGRVFLGRTRGGRPVAVKVVHSTLARDADFRRRFAHEVAAARKVGGFYTAEVVDADTDADHPWMATAYVAGLSLHRAVTTSGALPQTSTGVLGAGLAEGLAAVHAQGLVHRDLKPGNVVLGADGPRLIDFGIARALDGTVLTQTRTALGTLAFMSPEQAAAEETVSFASDVFSLGSVLVFAATGRGPFDAEGAPAVLYRLVHGAPELSTLPEDLAGVVAACLAKDPDQRPSPHEVVDRLSRLTDAALSREGWLPHDLTEEIDRQRTRVTSRTGPTKPLEDEDTDDPPRGRRSTREKQRESAAEDTGRLRVGNLTEYAFDVIVDGGPVGTVAAFATATFPLAAGGHAVQATLIDGGKASEPPRHLRVQPGTTSGIAFDYSNLESRPEPTDSVDYGHDTRGSNPWPGRFGIAAGIIGGLAYVMPPLFSHPHRDPPITDVLLFLGVVGVGALLLGGLVHLVYWAIAALILPKAPHHYALSLSDEGFTFTHDGTEVSLSWDDVDRITIVGERERTRLVVRPRQSHTTPSGGRVSGDTVLCELRKLDIAPDAARGRRRFTAALRYFAGERFQG